jgi:hypothetical protein
VSTTEFAYDQKGNISTFKMYQKGQLRLTGQVKYDTKNNPFLTYGLSNLFEIYGYPLGRTKNNITELTLTHQQAQDTLVKARQGETIRFTYAYNEFGFPTKRGKGKEIEQFTYTVQ